MKAFQARYIFPLHGPPLQGAVMCCDHRIHAVGENISGQKPIDLGNAAIVPGLINAHAHLELSQFDTPLGNPSHGFPAWIREVVAWRKAQAEKHSAEELLRLRDDAVRRGLAESLAAGVIAVADIASPGPPGQVPHVPARITFQEVLGLTTHRANALLDQSQAFIDQTQGQLRGLSPHAPYTVGIELLARLAELSAKQQIPLAMHLAESRDELELLQSHSGSFFPLLNDLDAWDASAIPRGIGLDEYLRILSTAHRALVIHGNYLQSEHHAFLAEHVNRMSVVYCPRTHAYFGHPRYPLPEMLAAGVNVAIGTDSRASNPDLNLWNELRYIADAYPQLSLETILRLGTESGAAALGFSDRGLLQPGYFAEFAIIDLPANDAADPYELIFDPEARVRSVYRSGITGP